MPDSWSDWQDSPEFKHDISFAERQIDDFSKNLRSRKEIGNFNLTHLQKAEHHLRKYIERERVREGYDGSRDFNVVCLCGLCLKPTSKGAKKKSGGAA